MEKTKSHSIFFIVLTLLLNESSDAQTIKEMYFDLPSDLIGQLIHPDEPIEKDRELRTKAVKVFDIKNGYLETKSGAHFAKFNRKDATPLFLIARGSYPEDGEGALIRAFQKEKKTGWEEVTKWYVPEIPMMVVDAFDKKKCGSKNPLSDSASGTYRYLLPSKGKVIRAVVNSDRAGNCTKDLFHLTFNGVKFELDY